jgi:hypothetical protein
MLESPIGRHFIDFGTSPWGACPANIQLTRDTITSRIDWHSLVAVLAVTTNQEQSKNMNTYNVKLRYEDRSKGSEGTTVKVDASSIAGAIAKAAREFVKALDRKQRFDANKGLQIEAVRVVTDKAETAESASAAQ